MVGDGNMRFKVMYDEKHDELIISTLVGKYSDIILPMDTKQHVEYPIPNEALEFINEDLQHLVKEEYNEEIRMIDYEIRELNERKRNFISHLRKELNPKIIEVCCEFRQRNPEFFI